MSSRFRCLLAALYTGVVSAGLTVAAAPCLAQTDATSTPSQPASTPTDATQSPVKTVDGSVSPTANNAVAPVEGKGVLSQPNPAASTITAAQAQQTLDILQDENKRRQLIDTLQTIVRATPGGAKPAPTPAPLRSVPSPPAPAPAAGTTAHAGSAGVSHLAPHSLGADILTEVSRLFSDIELEASKSATALTRFSSISSWVSDNVNDPQSRRNLLTGGSKFILVFACGLAAEWLLRRVTARPLSMLRQSPVTMDADDDDLAEENPPQKSADVANQNRRTTGAWRLLRRLPLVVIALLFDLLPVGAFAIVAYLVAGTTIFSSSPSASAAILAIVNAYVLVRVLMCIVRAILSPESSRLRLIGASTERALYLEKWLKRLLCVAIFGSAITEVAGFYGLEEDAHDALLKLVALIDHIFLVIMVLQCRASVANTIAAAPGKTRGLAAIRNALAATWHYIAIFYIVALWVVWAVEVKHGVTKLVHFFFTTVAVLIIARMVSILALGLLERALRNGAGIVKKVPGFDQRAERYHMLLRDITWSIIGVLTAVTLLEIWGFDAFGWFSKSKIGGRIVGAAVTISISIAIAIIAWEILTGALERHLVRLGDEGQFARAARLRTLIPMLRTTLMVALITVLGMTIMSQIGINIAPLLAGAGIIGVAVGFGSQKLVQDLITGIFLLLENAMQVGDWVSLAGLSGSVEHLSIRTIRLRAGDGSVHIVPFSAVTTVTNTNRGVGNAAVSVDIAYDEDADRVGEILKAIAAEMRTEDAFKPMMTGNLELWGVDKVDASIVTIVGQIACTDSGRWGVQREFNRRMKIKFQELGIRIALPTQRILLKSAEDDHEMPSVRPSTQDIEETSSTTVKESPPPSALSNKE